MKKSFIFAMLCLFVIALGALGCMNTETPARGSLKGTVTDEKNVPLSGVHITAVDQTTISDVSGNWSLSELEPLIVPVSVSRDGYENQTRSVEVLSGKTVDYVNFAMAEKGAVFSVSFTNQTSSSVTVSFATRNLCTSYVEYGTSVGYGYTTPVTASGSVSHSFNLDSLTPMTTYHVQCIATDQQNRVLRSGDKTFTTYYTRRGDPPQNLSVKQIGSNGGVQLSWSADTGADLSGYKIYRATSPTTGFTALATTGTTANSYLDTTANPGQKVYYMVTRVSGSGEESPGSEVVGFMPSGISKTNLVWSPDQNPIILTGDLTVRQDTTLTIMPGTVVKIASQDEGDLAFPTDGKVEIKIMGGIVIDTTASNPVTITSDAGNPTPGDWKGLTFDYTSNFQISSLKGLFLSFAENGVNGAYGLPAMDGSQISQCQKSGVICTAARSAVEVKNLTIISCDQGFYLASNTTARVSIRESTVKDCNYGIVSVGNYDSQILNNTVQFWTTAGIDVWNSLTSLVKQNVVGPGGIGTGIIARGSDEIRRNTVHGQVGLEISGAAETRVYSNLFLADLMRGGVGILYNGTRAYSNASQTLSSNDIWSQDAEAWRHRDKSGAAFASTTVSLYRDPALAGGDPFQVPVPATFSYQPTLQSSLKGMGYGGEDIGAFNVP